MDDQDEFLLSLIRPYCRPIWRMANSMIVRIQKEAVVDFNVREVCSVSLCQLSPKKSICGFIRAFLYLLYRGRIRRSLLAFAHHTFAHHILLSIRHAHLASFHDRPIIIHIF
jgi:hypothetical protein